MYTGYFSKCFVYKWWVGDKPTSRKIVTISKKYMWKQFYEVNAKAIIQLIVDELCWYLSPLRWIIVLYIA